jgi:MPBQ/MSBQ methyltransferase
MKTYPWIARRLALSRGVKQRSRTVSERRNERASGSARNRQRHGSRGKLILSRVALDPSSPSDVQLVATPPSYERLIAYYEGAGPDFEQWSPSFNMHFGFYRAGMNPCRREPMLNEMNRQVLSRLRLPPDRDDLILDLGCGVGATVRYAARMFPRKRVLGLTVVPWQVRYGTELNRRAGLDSRAKLTLADYTRSELPPASAAGAYAIESACHAPGADKDAFVREASRLLAPGARLVVADGFLKNVQQQPLGPLFTRLHASLCRSFVLPELAQVEQFAAALDRHGFTDIAIEDISWRVAPSALHAPLAVLWFRAKKTLRHEHLSAPSADNLRGSLLSAVLGANRRKFGYYLVSASRCSKS